MPRHLVYFAAILTTAAISSCSSLQLSRTANTEQETAVADLLAEIESKQAASEVERQEALAVSEPTEPADLLSAIASKFTWETKAENKSVLSEIRRHQKYPEHFYEIMQRSEPFLALIAEEIESQQLPAELALLPFVEAGYNPHAISPSGAAGLWQFMPSTARYMGMHIDWWYDERLDIDVSTNKALEYLNYLNTRFEGNWELTLAAYNGGEGHVSSRIKRAGGKHDFWAIDLKNETSSYVPKLLAIAEILAQPEKYGIDLPDIPLENQLATMETRHQIDLRLAAKEIGLEYQELKRINPGYLRWISPPTQNNRLLVPVEKESVLLASLDNIISDEQLAWNHYRVQRGDTLIEIAREFGTTLRALVSVNQLDNSRIYVNQDLLIPTSELSLTRLASQANSVKQLYIVKRGDSLWEISNAQGVPVEQIRRLNSIKNNHIDVDQVLILAETFTGTEITYLVKAGDSLSVIASRFQVAIADIRAWNALKGDLIRPGQELTIRPNNNS